MIRSLLHKLGFNSIQGRLTAIAFFFILVTAIVIGVAGFRLTFNFESRRFHEHFSLLATYLASNAEVGVLLGNEEALAQLSDNLLQVSDVHVVEIVDREDKIILRRANLNQAEELATVSAQVVTTAMEQGDLPMFGGDQEVLGKVYLSYSLAGLNRLKMIMAQSFLFASLLLAIVPIILYWLLSRAINAPLKGLLDVAGRVSQGQMDVRATSSSLKEIDTLSGAFNDMLDALQTHRLELQEANALITRQEVLAEVGKFSMTVAHEIKNPLAIIKGSLGIFRKDGPVDAEIKDRMMNFVDEEILRIDKLIEDFLLFARPRPPVFSKVRLQVLIDDLVGRVMIIDPAVQIKTDLEQEYLEAEIECDQLLIERALLNVVRNAMEAASTPEQVQLQIMAINGKLVFKVEDDGPGLDPDHLEKVFEPFFSCKSKGTGLGLAIASNALNAHGGRIKAVNREAGGASFTISLPMPLLDTETTALPDGAKAAQCRLEESH